MRTSSKNSHELKTQKIHMRGQFSGEHCQVCLDVCVIGVMLELTWVLIPSCIMLTWHSRQMKRTGAFKGVSELTNLSALGLLSLVYPILGHNKFSSHYVIHFELFLSYV